MFDVGASELLLIAVVAVAVIGPKDMPLALRTAGRWIGKVRKMSAHFRAGIDTIVWTFDPLVRRNARVNLLKLGVDVDGFEVAAALAHVHRAHRGLLDFGGDRRRV